MPDLDSFYNLPDISFIENLTVDSLLNKAVSDYETKYSELSGENKILYPADPMRILIQSYVLRLFQLYEYVDRAGKQDLLKYSKGQFLEHIAALRGVTRLPAQSATTTLRFTLSTRLIQAAIIPVGTLVTAGDNIFFATTTYAEIVADGLEVEIPAMCTTSGLIGNRYSAGRLNIIVQPFPYAASVTNIEMSSGGIELEDDQSLKERVFIAPSGYSVAGPEDSYVYWIKSFNQSIEDVRVCSPTPGLVDIRILLQNGELPSGSFLNEIDHYLKQKGVRPLTDHVQINAPEIFDYDIKFTYFIRSSDRNNEVGIQKRLTDALNKYLFWQGSKIGRDINPSVLNSLLMESGIKRVEINSPIFTTISQTELAKARVVSVANGGIEVD